MEKGGGANLKSSKHGDDRIHEENSEDSDDSIMAEKEDSADAASNETIEEENLDISSGSDHEEDGG